MDSNDVVAEAATPCIKGLMLELDVKTARMYEMLGKDNPYAKLWRILRPLGRLNPDGLRSVQADFNVRCQAIYADLPAAAVTTSQMHKELNDVIQSRLDGLSAEAQRREIRQAVSILCKRMDELENGDAQIKTAGGLS